MSELYTWGADKSGQLATGRKSSRSLPRRISFGIQIRGVSCGKSHAGFISEEGRLYTMGDNTDGRLGIGSKPHASSTPCLVESLISVDVRVFSAGGVHSAAVTASGELYSWGTGVFGNLGTGESYSYTIPHKVHLEDVRKVSCGDKHTGAITTKYLYMWGEGDQGQLGTGKRKSEWFPTKLPLRHPRDIACGVSQTLVITSDGLFSYGKTSALPVHISVDRPRSIACGGHSACIDQDGSLYVWGIDEMTSPVLVKSNVKDVSVGYEFTATVDSDGMVWTWGSNLYGELGLSDTLAEGYPVCIKPVHSVHEVQCGWNFVIALSSPVTHKIKTMTASRSNSNSNSKSPQKSVQYYSENEMDSEHKSPEKSVRKSTERVKSPVKALEERLYSMQSLYKRERKRRKQLEQMVKTNEMKALETEKLLIEEINQLKFQLSEKNQFSFDGRSGFSDLNISPIKEQVKENPDLRSSLDEIKAKLEELEENKKMINDLLNR